MSKVATPFGDHAAESHHQGDGMYRNEQFKFKFANGFGASVVRGQYTYGGDKGLWELAVLGQTGHLTYDTPITDDVEGYQTEVEIAALLDRIAALTAEVSA